jgi:hypothetical protein
VHIVWFFSEAKSNSNSDLATIFLTSKFSYLLFQTPPAKLKLWKQIGGRLLIPSHQSKTGSSTEIIVITLLWWVLGFAVPFMSLSKLWENVVPKLFCWAKPAGFDFYSSNFNLQGHILSSSGAAIREMCRSISILHVFLAICLHVFLLLQFVNHRVT